MEARRKRREGMEEGVRREGVKANGGGRMKKGERK